MKYRRVGVKLHEGGDGIEKGREGFKGVST